MLVIGSAKLRSICLHFIINPRVTLCSCSLPNSQYDICVKKISFAETSINYSPSVSLDSLFKILSAIPAGQGVWWSCSGSA